MIFHRIIGVMYSDRQRQSSCYIDPQMKQRKFLTMKRPQDRNDYVSNRQDSDLWIKILNEDTETGQRQNFNVYELISEEYL